MHYTHSFDLLCFGLFILSVSVNSSDMFTYSCQGYFIATENKNVFAPVPVKSPDRCGLNDQWPLLLTWFNLDPNMGK